MTTAGFLAKWGWIGIGLTFAFVAKYALLIKRGIRVRAWLALADIMLLPMITLIACEICERAGLADESRATSKPPSRQPACPSQRRAHDERH